MRWYELAENPRAITELYTDVPLLQSVRLREVRLDRDGPTMKFTIDLPTFPDKVPARWKLRGYNAVQMQSDFWWLRSIQIDRWSAENLVDIQIEATTDGLIALQAASPQCHIQAIAHSFRITLLKQALPIEKEWQT